MQKIFAVLATLGFVLLSWIGLVNFPLTLGQNETTLVQTQFNSTDSIDTSANSSKQFLTYTNPDYHFKLDYPAYLIPDETNLHANQVVKFTIPSDNVFQIPDVEVSVYVRSGLPSNATISDFMQHYESLVYQSTQNGEMKPISSNISKIGGNEVIDQVYYDYSNDRTMKVNTINIIRDGELFSLFYVTQPGLFNTYLEDFRQMVDSMEILSHYNTTLISTVNSIDEYANYFAALTQQSASLTKDYQEKIGEWELGQISNSSKAKLTDDYLKNFTTQLKEFNQTKSPQPFEATKNNMSSSFSNEIKSYEFFRDYLITGNETMNQLSTDYLSKSLEDESDAFKSFKDVVNGILPDPFSGLSA